MLKKAILSVLLGLFASPSFAATIYVEATGDDTVGRRLASELREKIARSAQHKMVYTREDAGFVIVLVTLEDAKNLSTAYSYALTMPQVDKKGFDYFMTSSVGVCGSDRVTTCAATIFAGADESISQFVSVLQRVFKENQGN